MKTLFEIIVVLALSVLTGVVLALGVIDDNEEIKAGKAPVSGFYPN